ncbi:MAG: PaaX family transcriptional regulator [Gemmatimonadota bacterium]
MVSRRPQDLVFTLFGEYLARLERPVWVGSLIALLRPFKVSEGAVRTVLSRMARKGWLVSRRSGRNSYYTLTARGRRIVERGEERIFHPPHVTDWKGRWFLVAYSIPEDVRHLRDRLRVRLAWLGFGSLGNGVWISPHDVHREVAEMADEMGLQGKLVCFGADQVGAVDHEDLVERCWDLPHLAERYRTFLSRWRAEARQCALDLKAGVLGEDKAFVLRFQLIHEYRTFPLEDPFLPDVLLPRDWPGREAITLFNDLHDLLVGPSDRYVASVLSREPAYRKRVRTGSAT